MEAGQRDSLDKAVVAVEKGMSIRGAAERFGIPRSTLYDHATGRIQPHAKPGPTPYLIIEEEEELASFNMMLQNWLPSHTSAGFGDSSRYCQC